MEKLKKLLYGALKNDPKLAGTPDAELWRMVDAQAGYLRDCGITDAHANTFTANATIPEDFAAAAGAGQSGGPNATRHAGGVGVHRPGYPE